MRNFAQKTTAGLEEDSIEATLDYVSTIGRNKRAKVLNKYLPYNNNELVSYSSSGT